MKIIDRLRPRKGKVRCRCTYQEILEVQRQLRDILAAQARMERMSQELDNLKVAVEDAVTTIVSAIEKITTPVPSEGPEIQAEAEKLTAAVNDLKAALG